MVPNDGDSKVHNDHVFDGNEYAEKILKIDSH